MPDYRDKSRGDRLQKVLAEAGIASRRDCEQMILEGKVYVNGTCVDYLPAWIDPTQDRVSIGGVQIVGPSRKKAGWTKEAREGKAPKRVTESKAAQTKIAPRTYIMLYKPRGVISTTSDPEGRKHVLHMIDARLNARLFPVGRLDADSTGLILLTDDGELANRLTHPRYGITKQYQVVVRGKVEEKDIERLRKGLLLTKKAPAGAAADVRRASVESVRIVSRQTDRQRGDRTLLHITLQEGQNREIRRILARIGFNVHRLKRVAIGPLKLKGLAVGNWRPLTPAELQSLKKATGTTRKKTKKT